MSAKLVDHLVTGPAEFGSPPGFAVAFSNTLPFDTTTNEGVFSPGGTSRGVEFNLGFSDLTNRLTQGTGWALQNSGDFSANAYALGAVIVRRLHLSWYGSIAGDIIENCHDGDAAYAAAPFSALYLGGNCQANVQRFQLPTTTGSHSFTGIGFQPDLLLFVGADIWSQGDDNGGGFMFGCADADLNQWAMGARGMMGTGPFVYGYAGGQLFRYSRFNDSVCIQSVAYTTGYGTFTVEQRAALLSMDADGFTLDIQAAGTAGDGSLMYIGVLAVKVNPGQGEVKVGTTVAGATPINCGFQPDAMILGQNRNVSNTLNGAYIWQNMGFVTADDQHGLWGGAASGFGQQSLGRLDTTHALWDAGVSDGIVSLDSTGATINWTAQDGNPYKLGWIAMKISDDLAGSPQAVADDPTGSMCNQVVAVGTVTPNTDPGDDVCVFIDYGPTTSYGSTISLGCAFSGSTPIPISQVISGLDPETTYHYRIRITQSTCTYPSNDIEFTTGNCEGLHLRPRILA